jgi:CRP-like cAMP-binding protein
MPSSNHVLSSLMPDDLALIQRHLEPVEFELRQSIEGRNKPIEFAYFPEAGIISIVALGGSPDVEVEVGIIGPDSMTAQPVILGADRSANSTFVQVAGRGQRISTVHLREAMRSSATLHQSLMLVVQAFIMQASQTALANGRGKLDERLARWLLMAHDRLGDPNLALTHEFLGIMLGVRRPGVTVALQTLQRGGFIATERRLIVVKDREGLERLASRVYGVAESEQTRLTGWKSRAINS